MMKWLQKLWEMITSWKKKKKKKSKKNPSASDLPDANLSRSAYSLDQYRSMPVHDVAMSLGGHNLTVHGDAMKLSGAFGIGCEITWWFKWDGKTYARVIEGFRESDCADGSATKDVPDGWFPFGGCGYYHGDGHTPTEEALTWWDVESDDRGENLGYSASKVISKRNSSQEWRSSIVMPNAS